MTAIAALPDSAPKKSFRDVWIITAAHSLTHWYPATFYLLLPLIGKELGLTYSQIGLVMTCQYAAGAIANIPGGMVVDTVGRKGFLMALSLFWVGFPYLLIGFTHSYTMLLLCMSLVGIGNNLWHPTAIPTLANRYPENKGLVLSIHGMGGNVGDALAPLVVGALLTLLTWREIVVVNVIPGLLMSGLLMLFLGSVTLGRKKKNSTSADSNARGQSVTEYFSSLKELLKNRNLIYLSTSSAFRAMTQNALLTFLPVYLAYEMNYNPFLVGLCMFTMQAAGFAASPISGHLSDKMGRRQIIMVSMGMTALVLLFMAFAGRSTVFVFFIAILGFFLYAIRPVLQAWLLESTPKNMGGTSIGILFAVQAAGSAVSPLIGGLLADKYGLMATFYFLAGTIIIANLFIFLMPDMGKTTPSVKLSKHDL